MKKPSKLQLILCTGFLTKQACSTCKIKKISDDAPPENCTTFIRPVTMLATATAVLYGVEFSTYSFYIRQVYKDKVVLYNGPITNVPDDIKKRIVDKAGKSFINYTPEILINKQRTTRFKDYKQSFDSLIKFLDCKHVVIFEPF